jgi:hypothetical protein
MSICVGVEYRYHRAQIVLILNMLIKLTSGEMMEEMGEESNNSDLLTGIRVTTIGITAIVTTNGEKIGATNVIVGAKT